MFYAVCSLLALGLLALDQWSKAWITANLPLGETMDFLPGVLGLRAVHNYGAAWSSFSGQRWLLVAVTGCIVLAVAVAPARRPWQPHRPGAAGVCGGHALLPLLALLSHLQRGGCVRGVRRRAGGGLLSMVL